MAAIVVFIAVGTLKADGSGQDRIQRGVNCDTYEQAERQGLRYLDSGHWSTFTVEKRYYPRAEPQIEPEAQDPPRVVDLMAALERSLAEAKTRTKPEG